MSTLSTKQTYVLSYGSKFQTLKIKIFNFWRITSVSLSVTFVGSGIFCCYVNESGLLPFLNMEVGITSFSTGSTKS